jgi:Spy/CpxP family protein refolding chaperone
MRTATGLTVCFALIFLALTAQAQNAPGGGAGSIAGGRVGGGPMDPGMMQVKITESIKAKLAPTDDEWKKLRPLIEKVQEAQRNLRNGAGMSFSSGPMMRGNANGKPIDQVHTGAFQMVGGGNAVVDTLPGQAMQDLRSSVDANAGDEELAARIKAFHEQRDAARSDLAAAQKALRQACTTRQEAILMTLGTLD